MITTDRITTTDVKRMNKNRIFRFIHFAGHTSRQEIADVLQLSLPTVNQNLKLLKDENLITFEGNYDSTGGRKAQVILANGMAKYAVSVNLNVSEINVSLVDLNGDIVCVIKRDAVFSADEDYSKLIAGLVEEIISDNGIDKEDVLGVGITVPGIFDNENEVIKFAPTMGIRNFAMSDITKYIPYECIAMNNAKAAAYAEFWFARKLKDENATISNFNETMDSEYSGGKIYVTLGNGVGGAYIYKERLVKGKHNRCAELGHMTIHPGGRQCFCGREGCLESYVSARCLSTNLGITLKDFFDELEGGNELYNEIFNNYIDDLTTGINNMYIMSDSDVVLGGYVSSYLRPYKDEIVKLLVEKYPFETKGEYFSFAVCDLEKSYTGAALTFLGDFIRKI